MLDKLSIRKKLYYGFSVVILLMLIVQIKTYMDFRYVSYIMKANNAIYGVLEGLESMQTNLVDTDTESGEYIMTGDIRHLNAFNKGTEEFQVLYSKLKNSVSLDKTQDSRLEQLKKDHDTWVEYQKGFHRRLNQEDSAEGNSKNEALYLTNLVLTGKSNDLMKDMRKLLLAIYEDGHSYLNSGSDELEKSIETIRYIILFGGFGVAVLGLLISFFTSVSIIKPLRTLVFATQRVKQHNYQQVIGLKASKDLGILIDNFNDMQVVIQNREEELRKKNEAIKAQMVEISEANKLKSQFLANMSHELRTPLNSIIGFTNRVIKKCADVLPPVQLDNLRIVKEESLHLLDLINNLLDYSKVEAGKMQLHIETFDLKRVIEEVSNMAKTLMEGKPLEYRQEFYKDESIMITSDQMKIKQILLNLISNAVKYSELGTIKLSVNRQQEEYCIKLEDEGIGIAPENIENIFDEFRQVDGSYTRKVGGTGLGLSITKKFTEMLGGRIEVESTVEIGSCFSVYLPVTFKEECPCEEGEDGKKNKEDCVSKMAVVCVDDDPNVQRLYKQYLQEKGYTWYGIRGNEEEDIIKKIAEIKPVAVILDIMLPKKDGWDILAELKANERTSEIPVLISSVLSEKNLAYRMKADEYLVKPISQDEFIDSINRIISKKEKTKEKTYEDENSGD